MKRILKYWRKLFTLDNEACLPHYSLSSMILTPLNVNTIIGYFEKLKNSPFVFKFQAILTDFSINGASYTTFDTFASFVQAFSPRASLHDKIPFIVNIFDFNENNEIEREEIKQWLSLICRCQKSHQDSSLIAEVTDLFLKCQSEAKNLKGNKKKIKFSVDDFFALLEISEIDMENFFTINL